MVKIEEEEEDVEAIHSTMDSSSSLSSSHHHHHHPHRLQEHNHLPSPPSPPYAPPPDSPDTSSSISSDHTFHGFSLRKENPRSASLSPSPPINLALTQPSPVLVPIAAPAVANRLVQDQPASVTKTESDSETGFTQGGGGGGGVGGRTGRQPMGGLRRARREKLVKRAGLGLRVCEFVVCLVSFSVMAADKNRGWALDSFDRYIEFRYSMSVNVIGFAYSGLQGLDLLCQLTTGKDLARSQLRYCFDFAMDQILAYLLLSASSSAFTRVDDWIFNWGQDKFPAMAGASVGVSFLAFMAFALSSLISGYILCTHSFT